MSERLSIHSWSKAVSRSILGLGMLMASNPVSSPAASVAEPSRLTNVSTRGKVETGDNIMIGGFIIGGDTPKTVLVRGRGPSMAGAPFNVPGTLSDPHLRVFSGPNVIAENNDWQSSQAQEIQSTGLSPCLPNPGQSSAPANCEKESAILRTLNPGPYTAHLSGANGETGVGLVEVFEVGTATATVTATRTTTITPTPEGLPRSITFTRNNIAETWSIEPNTTFGVSPNREDRFVTTININRGGIMSTIQPYESNFTLFTGNNNPLDLVGLFYSDALGIPVGLMSVGHGDNLRSADALAFDSSNPTIQRIVGNGMDKNSTTFVQFPYTSAYERVLNGRETGTVILRATTRTYNCDLTLASIPCVQEGTGSSTQARTATPTQERTATVVLPNPTTGRRETVTITATGIVTPSKTPTPKG